MTGGLLVRGAGRHVGRPVRRLMFVVGPTGVGKTDRSIGMERDTGARIIVLDRVQCHRELTVGSGRPEPDGTDRVFLADRTVAEGVIAPEIAYAELTRLLVENERAILEGGSMSMLGELARHDEWRAGAEITVDYIRPGEDHRDRIRRRVNEMLRGERTMLDELRDLWPDRRTHGVLAGIVGYREILAAAGKGYHFRFTGAALDRLVDVVTDAHLSYAAAQLEWFDTVLDTIRGVP